MGVEQSIRVLSAFLLLFAFALPISSWGEASDFYDSGVAAFIAGNYEAAREAFDQARAAGMVEPTLDYNIAVVNFKLGDYAAARANFERIVDDPEWGALARYNLGLVAEREGDPRTAQRHYAAAAREASKPAVRALAQAKLDAPTAASWTGFLSSAVGFDDDVTLAGSDLVDTVSDDEDLFVELIAAGSRTLNGTVDRGWRGELIGYYRKHQDLDEFDYGSGAANLAYTRRLGAWQVYGGVGAELQFVDSESFATLLHVRARASRPLGDASTFEARHESAHVDGKRDYAYLTGWRHRTVVELVRTSAAGRLRIGYQLELNDRKDLVFADEFFSYSPTRHRIYLIAETSISSVLDAEVRLGYRASRYHDANIEVNSDRSVTEDERNEDRLSAALRLEYQLSRYWQLFSEYNYADNDSNFARQSYHNNLVMVGLQASF